MSSLCNAQHCIRYISKRSKTHPHADVILIQTSPERSHMSQQERMKNKEKEGRMYMEKEEKYKNREWDCEGWLKKDEVRLWEQNGQGVNEEKESG